MTQLRSHPRLVRKLQDALGDQLCIALDDATVVEIMLNPDGRLFIERLGHGVAPAGAMSTAAAEVVAVLRMPCSRRPTTSGLSSLANCRLADTDSRGCCRRWSPDWHSRSAVVPRVSFH